MKIAFIAHSSSIHSYKWIKYFADKGHEIAWFSATPDQKYSIISPNCQTYSGIKHTDMGRGIMAFNPDILHAHYAGNNGFFGSLINKHPFIITVWGSDVLVNKKHLLKRQLLKNQLNCADLITTDADFMIDEMVKLGVKRDKIKHINFGVDTEMFKPNKIKHDGKVVVSLRSLEPIYDVETLIKAIPIVVKEIDDVLFKIYGDGSQREYLEKLATDLGVSDHVEFCGMVDYKTIPTILNSSDLYVSTSLSDAGLASSTAEAMACGLPVIVSNVYDNENWVGLNQLFAKGTPYSLAKNIIEYFTGTNLYLNRDKIVKRDNYLTEMEKMERIYEECLDNRKS